MTKPLEVEGNASICKKRKVATGEGKLLRIVLKEKSRETYITWEHLRTTDKY